MAEVNEGAHTVVEHDDGSGTVVVRISGELDMSSAPAVRRTLAPVLDARPARVIFDLGALEFIDSSGLAVLLQAAEQVDDIVLRNPTGIVQRVVEATGLEATLPVEGS
ncbi:MAG TPA: STAS domain-containing protein [Acidimicrobiia bacterium]|nr:STAS domain-containing protein [Acidimicrobiia bacterium]